MKKKVFIGVLCVLTVLAAVRIIPGMVESSIPSIYYITPTVKTYENVINCTGTIQADNIRQVYASSAFVPEQVLVSVGDWVETGDLLITVDEVATQELGTGALASLEQAAGNISDTLASVDLVSLLSAYGVSSLLGGEMDLEAISGLLGGTATTDTTMAQAVSTGPEFTEIRAPISGIVTDIGVQQDIPAPSGKILVTILDTDSYKAVVSVGEADITKISLGDHAVIRGVGFGGNTYVGEVSKIYPTAYKTLTGTATETVVDVEITLKRPDNNLKAGFSAKVEISGGAGYDLITVPYEAIRQDERNNEYVYTYEDGKLQKTTIVTGQELTNEVEVLGGLSFDSVVIFNPDDVAGEGSIVNIKGRADVS